MDSLGLTEGPLLRDETNSFQKALTTPKTRLLSPPCEIAERFHQKWKGHFLRIVGLPKAGKSLIGAASHVSSRYFPSRRHRRSCPR